MGNLQRTAGSTRNGGGGVLKAKARLLSVKKPSNIAGKSTTLCGGGGGGGCLEKPGEEEQIWFMPLLAWRWEDAVSRSYNSPPPQPTAFIAHPAFFPPSKDIESNTQAPLTCET